MYAEFTNIVGKFWKLLPMGYGILGGLLGITLTLVVILADTTQMSKVFHSACNFNCWIK